MGIPTNFLKLALGIIVIYLDIEEGAEKDTPNFLVKKLCAVFLEIIPNLTCAYVSFMGGKNNAAPRYGLFNMIFCCFVLVVASGELELSVPKKKNKSCHTSVTTKVGLLPVLDSSYN